MATYELENLKSNIGFLVSTNEFLSSSTSPGVAKLFFAGCKDTNDYKVVIFEITADVSSLKNLVFVDIDKCLGINCESEILFNIGSIFKIEDVNHNSDIGAPIGNYTQALEYYTKVLHCRNDQSNMARIRLNIGAIYSMSNDCEKGLKLCIEVRDIIQQVQLCPYNEIIRYQGIIGDINLIQKDYDTAEHYYIAAFETSKRFLFTDHRLRLHCIKSLTDLYVKRNMKEYAIQFCLDQLSVYEIYLPEIRVNIANLSMKISELFEDSSDQKQDLLLKALRILETSVHLEYVATINCLMMITEYYQKQNFDERASNYYIRALGIRKKIYPKDDFIILKTQSLIDTNGNQT
ncbi:unnamed protein product [Rotaria socialis]